MQAIILTAQSFQVDAQLLTWLFTLVLLGAASYTLIRLGIFLKNLSDLLKKSEADVLKTLEHTKIVSGNLVDLSDDIVVNAKPNLDKTTEMVQHLSTLVGAGTDLSLNALDVANHFVSALSQMTQSAPDVMNTVKTILRTVKFVKKFSSGRTFKIK